MHRVLALLIPLLAAAAGGYASYTVVGSVAPDIDDVSSNSSAPASLQIVDGDAKDSLLRRENLQKVLDAMRKEFGAEGQLSSFRLAPSNVNLTVAKRGGGSESVIYDRDAKIDRRNPLPISSPSTFPILKLRAKIPERIMRAVKEKSGAGLGKVDYMVAFEAPIASRLEWSVFLKDASPNHYIAGADGTGVRAPGEVTTPVPTQTRVITGEKAREINDCIQKAGADAARIQDCLK